MKTGVLTTLRDSLLPCFAFAVHCKQHMSNLRYSPPNLKVRTARQHSPSICRPAPSSDHPLSRPAPALDDVSSRTPPAPPHSPSSLAHNTNTPTRPGTTRIPLCFRPSRRVLLPVVVWTTSAMKPQAGDTVILKYEATNGDQNPTWSSSEDLEIAIDVMMFSVVVGGTKLHLCVRCLFSGCFVVLCLVRSSDVMMYSAVVGGTKLHLCVGAYSSESAA